MISSVSNRQNISSQNFGTTKEIFSLGLLGSKTVEKTGALERAALIKLLKDIREGKINTDTHIFNKSIENGSDIVTVSSKDKSTKTIVKKDFKVPFLEMIFNDLKKIIDQKIPKTEATLSEI